MYHDCHSVFLYNIFLNSCRLFLYEYTIIFKSSPSDKHLGVLIFYEYKQGFSVNILIAVSLCISAPSLVGIPQIGIAGAESVYNFSMLDTCGKIAL